MQPVVALSAQLCMCLATHAGSLYLQSLCSTCQLKAVETTCAFDVPVQKQQHEGVRH